MKKFLFLVLFFVIITHLFPFSFGKNKVQAEKLEWSKIETLHFDIYFSKGDDEFGKIAALMTEEAYYYLKEDFKTPIRNRIPVIFYKSHRDFETTNIIYPLLDESVGGFTESFKNRVAIPFDGSYSKMEKTLVHELTHAYINEIAHTGMKVFNLSGIPFWFSEGLPEFEAVGGEDVYNNMFILDLLLSDKLFRLDNVGGYYAYREGESFLTYLSKEYGRESVMDLFYSFRISSLKDTSFKKIFTKDFKEMQQEWENYLKRLYFPLITEFDIPYEVFERKTNHIKDGSNMNVAPSFSPDGLHYLYFSNKNLRTGIWQGSTLDISSNKEILKGEISGKFEAFHFQRNNFSWFPDGDTFAFVAQTPFCDKIYTMSLVTGAILDEFSFPDFDAIYEIDVSHDGKKIAFSGQKNHADDIFVFNIESSEITQITNDLYYDLQPSWSDDDSKIVFTSERTTLKKTSRKHIFGELCKNIYYYDFSDDIFYRVTNDNFNNYSPDWIGDELLFISEREFTSNFELIDLNTGKRARVTNVIGGVTSGDIDAERENLILSCFHDKGWDIYIKSQPLENLIYEDYHLPQICNFTNDLYEKFNIENYKLFGKKEKKFKDEYKYHSEMGRGDIRYFVKLDSLNRQFNLELDKRPTKENIPEILPYKTKFEIDRLWGGMAYSASGGTYGFIMLSLSDLMGNHSIGLNVGLSEELKNSDFIINYLYLARRIDYGFGGFYLNDEIVYSIGYVSSSDVDYMREREREFGFYSILSYPISKFWRVDFENILYKYEIIRDWWDPIKGKWKEEYLPQSFQDYYNLEEKDEEYIVVPQITFIHDNSIYGSVGPIAGWRGAFLLNRGFSNENKSYSILYTDLRKYCFFAKRYSFASRFLGGVITGESNQRFALNGFYGVRGFEEDDLEGTKKIVTNFELRFPFIDNFKISFPLPILFYNIRGSAFVDLGSVWEKDNEFKPVDDYKLSDLKMGLGFGPRLNMGFFVLKFDIAWNTDLETASKPVYYFSLSPDF